MAVAVIELGNEVDGFGACDRGLQVGFAGVGPAVENVVAHGAVQQRGVLRDHADCLAQAVLRDLGDVLAVDQDAAGAQVVKAQQQVDQGRLARARTADQAYAFAGAYREVQVLHHGLAVVVAERHVVKYHFAARDLQRPRLGRIEHRGRMGQGVDAVLDGAHAFKQAGHFPHHPARMARDAQRHRRHGRDRARAHLALHPQPQRQAAGAQNQQHDQHMVDDFKLAHQAHLRIAREAEGLHGRAREFGFAARVRKQLDGGDVGIGVGDAAGHLRARVGLGLAHGAQARNEIAAGGNVGSGPQQQRHQQPGVEARGQHHHGHEVDRHADNDVGGGEDHVAHRQRGLHDLGGDAAGELVGVERHALAEHQPVEVPAQAQREVDRQHLVLDQRLQRHQAYAQYHDRHQTPERAALLGQQLRGLDAREPVDDAAHDGKQPGFVGGRDGREQRHRQHIAAQPLGAGPDKRQKTARQGCGFGRGIGGNAFFEESVQDQSLY